MRIISFAIWFVPPLFRTVFDCVTNCRTARIFLYAVPCVSFRLIRNTGDQAGVLLARRSTPTYRDLSAARLSDILPGSYLLAEQSPGSSQLQTPPGVQHPSRAYPHIIKEKSPCVKGIFLFCLQNFHLFFVVFAHHAIVFTVPTNSGTLLLSKITNRNGLSRSISTVGGTSIMAESAQTISV